MQVINAQYQLGAFQYLDVLESSEASNDNSIKIAFVGDVSLSGTIRDNVGSQLVDNSIKKIFDQSNLVIGNFESVIAKDKESNGQFLSHEESAKILKNSGFTHLSLANNHIYDYGEEGFINTKKSLESNGIGVLGLKRNEGINCTLTFIEKRGVKIGILGAGWTKINQQRSYRTEFFEYDKQAINRIIRENASLVDHLILYVHKGKMFLNHPSPKDMEDFKDFRKLGANVIVGHHPHVLQGLSGNQDHLIAYSLGNFLFDSNEGNFFTPFSWKERHQGGILRIALSKGQIDNSLFFPTVNKNNEKSEIADKDYADHTLNRLRIISSEIGNLKGKVKYYSRYLKIVFYQKIKEILHKLK
jgi:poly-gamma-glutamate synthesis protein (capsule biosynthesis protein)